MRISSLLIVLTLHVTACGSSTSNIVDCTGVCSAGLTCDSLTGKCVSPTSGAGGGQALTGMPCDVAAALASRCTSCHGSTPSGGAPNSLVTRNDLVAVSSLGGTIASRSLARMKNTQNPMPPSYSGSAVTSAEVAAFQQWVDQGLPAGACAMAGSMPVGGGGGGVASGGGSATGGAGGTGGGMGAGGGSGAGGGMATGGGTNSPYCRSCTGDADCGSAANFCIGFSFGDFCGVDCSMATCGAGQRCANIIDSSTNAVIGKNCVPVTGTTCSSGAGGGGGTGGGGGATGGGTTGGGGGSSCGADTWSNYGASFFSSQCASCHHHTGEFTTRTSVVGSKSAITTRISLNNMPPNGLTSAAKTRILNYLNCGVP